eukprot:Gb_11612 [translate_table: standard]
MWNRVSCKLNKTRLYKPLSSSGPFVTARWTFVLLDVFCSSRCNLHAFAMEPFLTNVTTDPKLIRSIIFTTGSTECITMLLLILFIKSIILFLGW